MNMQRCASTFLILLFSGLALKCVAQTPLSKAFADMHSNDPEIVKKARDSMALLAEKEMPTIEKDATTLCQALTDKDSMIRQQAAGIIGAIVVAAPQHNQVVVSCFPQLLVTATDQTDYVRNDSLLALAMNPAGPPAQAHDIFVKSLSSSNFRTAQLGVVGLLKEKGLNAEANQELVRKALDEAPDAKHRLNMLYAIIGANVPSETLFQSAQKYLYDSDPEVRTAAIDAVGATATDKSRAIAVMQNIENSPSLDWEQKNHVKGVLNSLKASR